MRNEMLWLNIKSILASKENQVSKPLITEHHPVFSKVRIKGACLEIYGVVTGLILVGLSSDQKRYHIKLPNVLSPGQRSRKATQVRKCKLANTNLRWVAKRTRKFNSNSKKAISVQHCTRARTKENNTETNLHRLALRGQTVKNLRSIACKFDLDQSERRSSQVIASTRKSWPNGGASNLTSDQA